MALTFYRCTRCGNLTEFIHASGVTPLCCGEAMIELVPGTSDGAKEKHVPVISCAGNVVTVKVGETAHPMTEEHSIRWIALETKLGCQRKQLTPGSDPAATFGLTEGDEPIAAYAYCNLHSLYKGE